MSECLIDGIDLLEAQNAWAKYSVSTTFTNQASGDISSNAYNGSKITIKVADSYDSYGFLINPTTYTVTKEEAVTIANGKYCNLLSTHGRGTNQDPASTDILMIMGCEPNNYWVTLIGTRIVVNWNLMLKSFVIDNDLAKYPSNAMQGDFWYKKITG